MQQKVLETHLGVEKQRKGEFEWGNLFYEETPVDIIKIIVAMEEDLIRMVEFEHGAEIVVSPFWVTCILLAQALNEWIGFGTKVSIMVQDMRMMSLATLVRLDDMAKMAEPPFKKGTNRARPSGPVKTTRSEEGGKSHVQKMNCPPNILGYFIFCLVNGSSFWLGF